MNSMTKNLLGVPDGWRVMNPGELVQAGDKFGERDYVSIPNVQWWDVNEYRIGLSQIKGYTYIRRQETAELPKVVIHMNPGGSFDVRVGDRFADGVTFDEMLGLVASITLPQDRRCLSWLKTEAEHRALRAFFPSNELAEFEVSQ